MKKNFGLLKTGTLCLALCLSAFSYADIAGTWQGSLEIAPGSTLDVQFIIEEKADGTITVVLNSPKSGAIKNVRANSASFSDSMLKLEVAELSGAYEGKLENGTLSGNWKQLDQAIPLALTPFTDSPLAPELLEQFAGQWTGALDIPGRKLNILVTLEKTDNGKLKGTMQSPDQGPQQFALEELKVSATEVSFVIPQIRGNFKGMVSGSDIDGEWSQGQNLPLKLSKGGLDPNMFALDLSGEAKTLLLGQWHGEMTTPVGPVAAVFRIVEEKPGFIRGYFDSPDRGAVDMPLKEAKLEGDTVTLAVGNGSTFTGKVSDGALAGDYSQQGQKLPVTLNKGKLPALALDIPTQNQSSILGNWTGKLNTPRGELTVGIRFEKTSDGKVVGYLDSPDQGMNGARIRFASFDEGALTVRSTLLRMEYKGTLADNTLKGNMSQGGQNLELNLAKAE